MKTIHPYFACISLFLISITSYAQDIRWQTDNTVYSSVMIGDSLYLGGNFNYIGKYTGANVLVPETSGNMPDPLNPRLDVPSPTVAITSIIPDGSGGYFIAGEVTYWDPFPMSPSAHILHVTKNPFSGNRDVEWAIRTDGQVNCLFLMAGTLYVGGRFGNINSTSRRNIAALDPSTAAVRSWNPGFTAPGTGVFSITGTGSVLYVGGGFTFGTFKNLAAINTSTAASVWATPNNPNGDIRSVAYSAATPSRLYVCGDFNKINALVRTAVAAVNTADGSPVTGFDAGNTAPYGTNVVRTMAISADGSTLYVGGLFGGFQSRNNLLALNAADGIATSWNPNANGEINSIVLSPATNRMYVGGTFKSTTGAITIGGRSRNYLAAIDITTGLDDGSWVTFLNGAVKYISVTAGDVYLGGEFTSVGGGARNRLAAINYRTNTLLSWNPDADGPVRALIHHRQRIIAGGDFTNVGGLPRQRVAALNMVNGAPVAGWSADANATVRALYAKGSKCYVGGDFTVIGGQSRNRLAKLDTANGAVNTWNPGADNLVRALTGFDDKVIAGGDFTNAGGQARSKIAAFDTTGIGAVFSWYLPAGATGTTSLVPSRVNALAVYNKTIYAGGSFATMGGQNKKNIVAIDDNGLVNLTFSANPNSANEVNVILVSGSKLYVGGSFNDMSTNLNHKHLAEIDRVTGAASTTWYASPAPDIYTVAVSGTICYFGGAFVYNYPAAGNPQSRNTYLGYHNSNGLLVLPVQISHFTVKQQGASRLIHWNVLDEKADGTEYEIQRSIPNKEFNTIIQQQVNRRLYGHTYDVTDNELLPPGTYYYRLKVIQPDGSASFSAVQAIKINAENGDRIITTVIANGAPLIVSSLGNHAIYLYNTDGQTVGVYALRPGLNNIPVNSPGKGVYLYSIIGKSPAEKATGKIIIR